MFFKVFCAVVLIRAFAHGSPAVGESVKTLDNSVHTNDPTAVEESLMKKLNTKCIDRDVNSCMMVKFVQYVNRLLKKSSIEIGNVEITQKSDIVPEETARSFDLEGLPEDAQLNQLISNKIWSFVKSRSLKWKISDNADVVLSTNNGKDGSIDLGISLKPGFGENDEARKKKGGMGGIIALAAMKIGLLKGLAFKALALLVGKALIVAKLALVLASIIGLKKLFHQEKHVTYEVVAHPHHEHHEVSSGHDYGHGWGRNLDGAELAYNAHKPSA